jgi:hypothetical protein
MDRTTLAITAREYWEKWRPKKTAELKAAGKFTATIQIAAVYAQAEIAELMMLGYQEHEAAEVTLLKYIFLEP